MCVVKVREWIIRPWMNGNRNSFQNSLLIMKIIKYFMPMGQAFFVHVNQTD